MSVVSFSCSLCRPELVSERNDADRFDVTDSKTGRILAACVSENYAAYFLRAWRRMTDEPIEIRRI